MRLQRRIFQQIHRTEKFPIQSFALPHALIESIEPQTWCYRSWYGWSIWWLGDQIDRSLEDQRHRPYSFFGVPQREAWSLPHLRPHSHCERARSVGRSRQSRQPNSQQDLVDQFAQRTEGEVINSSNDLATWWWIEDRERSLSIKHNIGQSWLNRLCFRGWQPLFCALSIFI